jgi:hypothetical protein
MDTNVIHINRIPNYEDGKAYDFFNKLWDLDLTYHPEDDPADVVQIRTGVRVFNSLECDKLNRIMDRIREVEGDPCDPLWQVGVERGAFPTE